MGVICVVGRGAAAEQPLHLPEPRDGRLRAVTHLIESDVSSPANLTTLGHRVGASERTLSRLFHAETGMSFPSGARSCASTAYPYFP